MARTQAADFDQRREAIVDQAARLFAAQGFPGASMSDLAAACSISKSLLYHYFPSKEAILHALMSSHLESLWAACEQVLARELPPAERLRALTHAFMALYVQAAHRQAVLVSALDHLPPAQRGEIVARQRQLIGVVAEMMAQINPGLVGQGRLRAAAMLFFGLINWTHTWYDPYGPVAPDDLADMAVTLALSGLPAL